MNLSVLLTIISISMIVLYRLGKGDLLFFTRPEIYIVIVIGLFSYFIYNKLSSNIFLIIQLILSLLTTLYFSISRNY
jgi:hypothetical protein